MVRFVSTFFIIAVFFNAACEADEVKAGKLTGASGLVTIHKVGAASDADVILGDVITVGGLLRTGKDSVAQLTFSDGSFVNLSPETSLRVNQYIYERGKKQYDPDVSRKKALVRVIGGQARFIVLSADKGTSAFRVETENASIETSAGDFVVSVLPRETEVIVLHKTVKVSNVSFLIPDKVQLLANQRSSVREKSPPSKPSAITSQQRKSYTSNFPL